MGANSELSVQVVDDQIIVTLPGHTILSRTTSRQNLLSCSLSSFRTGTIRALQ